MTEFAAFFPLDDQAGPAKYISDRDADELIGDALDMFEDEIEEHHVRTVGTRPPLRVLLIAAALVVTSAAVAATSTYYARKLIRPKPIVIPPVEPPPTQPAVLLLPAPDPEPPPAAKPKRKLRTPADLLREANRHRRAKRWRRAARVYRRVRRRFGESGQAYVSTVAEAAIQREQLSSPGRALKLYKTARKQRPYGVLDAEIRFGCAQAHRDLGDRDQERAALKSLLRAHPRSPFTRRAQARVDELSR